MIKLLFRARAWQNIVRAAYPACRLRYRSALGAYIAGVGVNSILPARGGDVVKVYLVKSPVEESTYPTLASTLVVETIFDFFIAGGLLIWALSIGVLPPTRSTRGSRPSTGSSSCCTSAATLIGLALLGVAAVIGFFWARLRVEKFWSRVRLGFAILGDRRRFVLGVLLPQTISWVFRIASLYFFLQAFGVHASIHNALLAQVVDSLATLFPATPGGAGTKQGLIVFLFRGQAISRSLLLAFSVGMNIAITVVNLLLGLIAIGLMARTLSFKNLRQRSRAEQEQPA